MIDNTPHQPTYTVFVYGGKTFNYSNVTDLDNDWNLFGYGIRTTVGNNFNPVCKRCGKVNYDRINDKCTYDVCCFVDGKHCKIRDVASSHELTFDIIIKDDFGAVFDFNTLNKLFEDEKPTRVSNYSISAYWRSRVDVEEFEKQYKHLYARYGNKTINHYRSIRTFNERKQYDKCRVDDCSPLIRAKRSIGNIPNSWDDISVSKWYNCKNWKTQKVKKQWMINS